MYNYFSIAFWSISFYSRWLHVTLQTHTNFKVQGLAWLFFLVLFGAGSVCLFIVCLFFGGGGVGWFWCLFVFKQPSHLTIKIYCRSRFSFYFKLSARGSNAWILIIEIIPLIKLAIGICNFENHQPSKKHF